MGLKQVLHKLKLVELDGAAEGAQKPLEQLVAEVPPAPEIDERKLPRAKPEGGAEALPQFAEVYAAAGISEPAHGFSALKILEILQASEFAGLEPKAKAAALLGFLKMNPGGPVAIADVVQDAVRRDQALDKFEEFLRTKLAERGAAVNAENGRLQAEMDELARRHRARMDAGRAALDAERRRFSEWQEKKRAEERRLAAAVEPFVERSPIST